MMNENLVKLFAEGAVGHSNHQEEECNEERRATLWISVGILVLCFMSFIAGAATFIGKPAPNFFVAPNGPYEVGQSMRVENAYYALAVNRNGKVVALKRNAAIPKYIRIDDFGRIIDD